MYYPYSKNLFVKMSVMTSDFCSICRLGRISQVNQDKLAALDLQINDDFFFSDQSIWYFSCCGKKRSEPVTEENAATEDQRV